MKLLKKIVLSAARESSASHAFWSPRRPRFRRSAPLFRRYSQLRFGVLYILHDGRNRRLPEHRLRRRCDPCGPPSNAVRYALRTSRFCSPFYQGAVLRSSLIRVLEVFLEFDDPLNERVLSALFQNLLVVHHSFYAKRTSTFGPWLMSLLDF